MRHILSTAVTLSAITILSACQTTGLSNTGSSPHWSTVELVQPKGEVAPVTSSDIKDGQTFTVDVQNALFVVKHSAGVTAHPIANLNTCDPSVTTGGAVGVQAGPECILSFSKESSDYQKAPPEKRTVVVLIHGDTYLNGRVHPVKGYHTGSISTIVENLNMVKVFAPIRPGESTAEAGASSGNIGDGRDNYSLYAIDTMAATIRQILVAEGTENLLLVGHSGGAAISALMLDRHPDLAQHTAAYLAGLAGDRDPYRAYRAASLNEPAQLTLTKSPDPIKNIAHIRSDVPIMAVTGDKDTNTKPEFAQSYITALQARGLNAEFHLLPNAEHYFSARANVGNIMRLQQQLLRMSAQTAQK